MKILFALILLTFNYNVFAIINHKLEIEIEPAKNFIKVIDTISFDKIDCSSQLSFTLHDNLKPTLISPQNGKLKLLSSKSESKSEITIDTYSLTLPCTSNSFIISYEGIIYHPVKESEDPYSRGTSDSPGLISIDGVVLSSGTYWYPQFENYSDLINFHLKVKDESGFTYMSQGKKLSNNEFIESTPQEEIYLVGAKFSLYEKQTANNLKLTAYLRSNEDELAAKYLDSTETYLNRYSKLIGPYPYQKFDLVENFWDTGFGMPSFTLLGSNIIRLPFIINTSYPHEILHDWWGNSVYVDYNRGNWCEGLTAYMADHLMAEINKTGDTYRRDTLQKFTDFVTIKNDFPLNKFINRYNASTEAIGYGKALMFFHMLRNKLGDDTFKKAISHFYSQNIFTNVSYDELKSSFEKVSGIDLKTEFDQWVTRTGAPFLKITEADSTLSSEGYILNISLEQIQNSLAFNLEIPLAITLLDEDNARQIKISMSSKKLNLKLKFDKRPIFLQVDPEFDLMRILSTDEVPAVMTMPLGASETYFVMPSNSTPDEMIAWSNFIDIMKAALPKESLVKVVTDKEIKDIPKQSSLWILGNNNLLVTKMNQSLKKQNSLIALDRVIINNTTINSQDNNFTIVDRDQISNSTLTYVNLHDLKNSTILANKLIHYGKYSYLVFSGDKLTNSYKGVWKLQNSSMSIPIIQNDGTAINAIPAKLLPRGPLAN